MNERDREQQPWGPERSEEAQARALYFDSRRFPELLSDWHGTAAWAREVALEQERLERTAAARRAVAAAAALGSFAGFAGLSLRDALAIERAPVPWLIEGLQRRGHKASLVAQYKTGKTTFAANVVRSLADGVPLLDRFSVPALDGRIGVFDHELTTEDAQDLYRAQLLDRPDRVTLESLRSTGFSLANDTHAEWAVSWLRDHDIAYWVIDPFGRAMRGFGEENSNDDVRAFMMRLDEIAADAGVQGVLLTVHTGRAEVAVGAERARGASVLDDDPDVRWLLTRNNDGRYFRAEGRAGVDVREFALQFDSDTQRLSATGETRAEVAGARLRPAIADWVRANPGATVRDIKGAVSGKDSAITAALRALCTEGVIEVKQDGRARRHYLAGATPRSPSSEAGEQQRGREAQRGPTRPGPNASA